MASRRQGTLLSVYRSFLRELPPVVVTEPVHIRFKQHVAAKHVTAPTSRTTGAPRTYRLALHETLRQYFSQPADILAVRARHSTSQKSLPNSLVLIRVGQAIKYLEAQRSYVELLERYNPGLSEEGEDRIRRSARRVGLETTT